MTLRPIPPERLEAIFADEPEPAELPSWLTIAAAWVAGLALCLALWNGMQV